MDKINLFFQPSQTSDEKLFTHNVMAHIRAKESSQASWPFFFRWAVPVLGLSVVSFCVVVQIEKTPISTSSLLTQNLHDSNTTLDNLLLEDE